MASVESRDRIETDVLDAMRRPGPLYRTALAAAVTLVLTLLSVWMYQVFSGLGTAGICHPVGWGVYITNFVFWVGIAHSGTLISAVLFLFRARFRKSFKN